jgi:hypothetical protein
MRFRTLGRRYLYREAILRLSRCLGEEPTCHCRRLPGANLIIAARLLRAVPDNPVFLFCLCYSRISPANL